MRKRRERLAVVILTIFLVTARPTERTVMVINSWTLLKVGLSTSKDLEGDTREPKRSSPEAKRMDSDSRRPGNDSTLRSPST